MCGIEVVQDSEVHGPWPLAISPSLPETQHAESGREGLPNFLMHTEREKREDSEVLLEGKGGQHLNKTALGAVETAKVHNGCGAIPDQASNGKYHKEAYQRPDDGRVKMHHTASHPLQIEEEGDTNNDVERKDSRSHSDDLYSDRNFRFATKVRDAERTSYYATPNHLVFSNHQPEGGNHKGQEEHPSKRHVQLPHIKVLDVPAKADVESNGAEGKKEVVSSCGTSIGEPEHHPFPLVIAPSKQRHIKYQAKVHEQAISGWPQDADDQDPAEHHTGWVLGEGILDQEVESEDGEHDSWYGDQEDVAHSQGYIHPMVPWDKMGVAKSTKGGIGRADAARGVGEVVPQFPREVTLIVIGELFAAVASHSFTARHKHR